jgi:hypothetical protein
MRNNNWLRHSCRIYLGYCHSRLPCYQVFSMMTAKLKLFARLQWMRLKRWHYNEKRWDHENAAMRCKAEDRGEMEEANKYKLLTIRAEADVLELERMLHQP